MKFQVDNKGQVFSGTILIYASSLRVQYFVQRMPLKTFHRLRPSFLIKISKLFFPHAKAIYLSIKKEILFKTPKHQLTDDNKLNIKSVFKVIQKDSLGIGKITFTAAQLATPSLKNTQGTKSEIFFSEFDQFVTLKIKTSKTGINHIRIVIVIGEP